MSQEFEPKPTLSTDSEANTWAMILHLSVFAGYVIPLAGLVAPIVIWQIKKDQMPIIDQHGKIVTNWIISFVIYATVSTILIPFIIGIIAWIPLGIASIAFPIIGGIKASNGEVWPYPLSIKFFN